jgi:hypothetical protein
VSKMGFLQKGVSAGEVNDLAYFSYFDFMPIEFLNIKRCVFDNCR